MKPKPRCRTKSSSASGKSTSKKHLTHRKGAYYYGYFQYQRISPQNLQQDHLGTAALRPEAVCADGFTLSIQASGMHYCIPNEDLSDGNYSKVELSYLSEEVEEFLPFAEDDEAPLATVYGYVPVETVDAVLAKHGGIVNA